MGATLKINPEFRNLIPPLAPEELAQLEENLVRDGCREPLVAWKGMLVDGHNRHDICTRRKVPFTVVEIQFADEGEAKVWIIRNQFGRRNLSAYERGRLALALEPLIARKAKANQKAGGQSSKVGRQKSDKPLDTKQELARAAGVSHDTIAKVKIIEAKSTDEVKAKLRSGEMSINEAYKIATGKGAHVSYNSGENEWYTPPEFIAAAKKAMGGIDTDPASSPIANRAVGATRFFTSEEDGLKQEWGGKVWMNPPYAQPLCRQFCEAVSDKFDAKEIEQAIVLVNNATETTFFQRMLASASAACFPKGRVAFLDPKGNPGAPLQGQAILYFGEKPEAFKKAFGNFGVVLSK